MIKRTKKNWTLREATPEDLNSIRQLYKIVWGHERPIEYDKWKYFNFFGGLSQISVAVVENRIIGVFVLAPVKLRIGSEIVNGGVAMDVMSHPDYVGTTVFSDVGKHCVSIARKRGFRLLYGFPNPLSFPGFVKRLNWDHVGDVNHYIRPIKPSLYLRVPGFLGSLIDFPIRFLPKQKTNYYDIRVGKLLGGETTGYLEALTYKKYKVSVCRDERWFNSRYADEARNNYEWVSVYEGSKFIALGVWGMRDKAWEKGFDSRAHITELVGDDMDALQVIVATIIKRAEETNAMLLETVTNNTRLEQVLKKCLFFKRGNIPMIVKDLSTEELPANIHHYPNWEIIGGDLDTF